MTSPEQLEESPEQLEELLRAMDKEMAAIAEQIESSSVKVRSLHSRFFKGKLRLWALMALSKVDADECFSAWRVAVSIEKEERRDTQQVNRAERAGRRIVLVAQRGRILGGLFGRRSLLDRCFLGWRIFLQLLGPGAKREAWLAQELPRLRQQVVDESLRREALEERRRVEERRAEALAVRLAEARRISEPMTEMLAQAHQALASETGDVVASGRAGLACDRAGIGAGAAGCLRAPLRPSGGFPRRSIFSCGTVGHASFEWHRCCAPRRRLHAERSPRSGSGAAWSSVGSAVLGDGGLPTADRRRPRRAVDAAMCCDGGDPTT